MTHDPSDPTTNTNPKKKGQWYDFSTESKNKWHATSTKIEVLIDPLLTKVKKIEHMSSYGPSISWEIVKSVIIKL